MISDDYESHKNDLGTDVTGLDEVTLAKDVRHLCPSWFDIIQICCEVVWKMYDKLYRRTKVVLKVGGA